MPTLYIFGGLPGVGKSTLAQELAAARSAAYLRVDTIEQTLRDAGYTIRGPEGYAVAWAMAEDILRLGTSVVADTVNPIRLTRRAWRDVGQRTGARSVAIHVSCSNEVEHRRRVETRTVTVTRLVLPSWADVMAREFDPWPEAEIRIDTSGEAAVVSVTRLIHALTALDPPERA